MLICWSCPWTRGGRCILWAFHRHSCFCSSSFTYFSALFFVHFMAPFPFIPILTMMSTIDLCYLLLILEDHWILKKLGSIEHSLVLIEPLLPSKEAHSKHTHTHKLLKWPLETSTWNKFKNHFGEMDGTKFKTISWLSWRKMNMDYNFTYSLFWEMKLQFLFKWWKNYITFSLEF